MAFTCGFFNSENGDRKYNAEQMSAIFDGIIADGVFTTIGDHMAVTAGTGMQVLVGTGKAWFDHTWNVNDAAYPLTIAASDVTLSRIDAIVLETNHSDSVRLNKLRVVQGTVASSPVKPTLTNSEKVHQHPLAWVTVAPGVTKIAASAIENAVGTSACPFVTGIIATTDIDDLFAQWNGEFDEWFDNLKAQLSDNVVANLQRQIDARVKIADKATADDIYNGTDDSKWVTAKGLTDSETAYQIGDVKATAVDLETKSNGKFLKADGRSISRSAYAELFSKIKTSYGEGSPSIGQDQRSMQLYSGYTVLNQSDLSPDGTKVAFMTYRQAYNSSNAARLILYVTDKNGGVLKVHELPSDYQVPAACIVYGWIDNDHIAILYRPDDNAVDGLMYTYSSNSVTTMAGIRFSMMNPWNGIPIRVNGTLKIPLAGNYNAGALITVNTGSISQGSASLFQNTISGRAYVIGMVLGNYIYACDTGYEMKKTNLITEDSVDLTSGTVYNLFRTIPKEAIQREKVWYLLSTDRKKSIYICKNTIVILKEDNSGNITGKVLTDVSNLPASNDFTYSYSLTSDNRLWICHLASDGLEYGLLDESAGTVTFSKITKPTNIMNTYVYGNCFSNGSRLGSLYGYYTQPSSGTAKLGYYRIFYNDQVFKIPKIDDGMHYLKSL